MIWLIIAAAVAGDLPGVRTAWRSHTWCLEVHPEKIVFWDRWGPGPKVALSGPPVETNVVGHVTTWVFEVSRIHRARWVSPCRKNAKSEALLDSYRVGALTLSPGALMVVRIEERPEGPQLCVVEECRAVVPEPLPLPAEEESEN